jgi:glycerol uptake facilitator-like aquaporin
VNPRDSVKKFVAEAIGTAFLVAAVVGSGIMAEKLSAGNVSLALLENSVATGAALIALILCFGPISGAHFNPAVTVADATQGGVRWNLVSVYVCILLAPFRSPSSNASKKERYLGFDFPLRPWRP